MTLYCFYCDSFKKTAQFSRASSFFFEFLDIVMTSIFNFEQALAQRHYIFVGSSKYMFEAKNKNTTSAYGISLKVRSNDTTMT